MWYDNMISKTISKTNIRSVLNYINEFGLNFVRNLQFKKKVSHVRWNIEIEKTRLKRSRRSKILFLINF